MGALALPQNLTAQINETNTGLKKEHHPSEWVQQHM